MRPSADRRMLSITVPLFNEGESVGPLVEAVRHGLAGSAVEWELILVDDGSIDDTAATAARLAEADGRVRLLRLARNYGQATAMQAGFDHARGSVVVSMDGDLQNDPRDIPRLVEKLDEGYDLVAGYRVRRKDRLLTRKLPSWVANRIIRVVTGVPIRDNGCSLKAYRRDVLQRVRLYSDMHRFIPVLAAATAGARIAEIPVRHHARRWGRSKYGLSRTVQVLADLLTITMIQSFRERPFVLYGVGGVVAMFAAVVPLVASFGAALDPARTNAVVVPASVAVCLVGLGCFLLGLGLIAESALLAQHEHDPLDTLLVREVA
jgi:glycosyltransferase involved in cell wall biosynthesis